MTPLLKLAIEASVFADIDLRVSSIPLLIAQ
jgi:hypothetical protein